MSPETDSSDKPDALKPAITSVKQPAYEIGQKATELLIKLIESKRPVTEFEKVVLQSELHIRDSTRKKIKMKNKV